MMGNRSVGSDGSGAAERTKMATDLPPALVPLAVPGSGTLGVTQVLLMAGHVAAVAPAAALLLHLLQGKQSVSERH